MKIGVAFVFSLEKNVEGGVVCSRGTSCRRRETFDVGEKSVFDVGEKSVFDVGEKSVFDVGEKSVFDDGEK